MNHRSLTSSMSGLLLMMFCLAARADLFVSPSGSDANPGSKTKPFSTIEKARDTVRDLKRAGKISRAGLTVWLRGGDFLRTNALELTASDSGAANGPIVWRAYADERVRLLGGRRLTGFQPVTNASVLGRLDAAARSHVLQIDLHALGITDYGDMKSRGFGRPTTPAHYELFFAGHPMTLARWPNEGAWEKIAGFPLGSGKNDDHGGNIGELPGGFLYSGERPRRWRDTGDLWVHGYWAWDWANSYERVATLDLDRHLSGPRRRTASTDSAPVSGSTISTCWKNSTNQASGSSIGKAAFSTSGRQARSRSVKPFFRRSTNRSSNSPTPVTSPSAVLCSKPRAGMASKSAVAWAIGSRVASCATSEIWA